jgi:lipid-A-disaccharide synthase-like uncharacterized protein
MLNYWIGRLVGNRLVFNFPLTELGAVLIVCRVKGLARKISGLYLATIKPNPEFLNVSQYQATDLKGGKSLLSET